MRQLINEEYYYGELKLWENARKDTDVAILVEAKTDEILYQKLLHKDIKFFSVDGCINLMKILGRTMDKNFILGIVDSDFRNCDIEYEDSIQNAFFTDYHDKEMMMFNSKAWENLVSVRFDKSLKENFEDANRISVNEHFLEISFTIGCYRYLNTLKNLSLKFKNISKDKYIPLEYSNFINKNTLEIDEIKLQKTIENKSNRQNFFKQNQELIEEIKILKKERKYNILDFCNGHDLIEILSLSLKKCFAKENVCSKDLEKELIISYRFEDFVETNLYKTILKWNQKNNPYRLLNS